MKLIKNPCTVVVPSNAQYTDDSTESATLTFEQLTAGRKNFFSLVSAVQSMRGPSFKREGGAK